MSEHEVYYCGHCKRQQLPERGELCIMCGCQTVSWFTDRESAEEVQRKWERFSLVRCKDYRERQEMERDALWECKSRESQRSDRERWR